MPFTSDEVAVRQCSDSEWVLLEDVVYEGRVDSFTVETGFKTDFASVPRAITWLVPTYGRYTKAAILHDFLCTQAKVGLFSRHDADGIFRRSMRELDVGFLRRWLMWVAVRFGGGWREFWKPSVAKGLVVLLLGLVAAAFLVVPLFVVAVWLALFWVLEWVLLPGLKLLSRRKRVNRPLGLGGT